MGSFSSCSYPSLADAACIHALEYFQIRISLSSELNSLAEVDEVLDACRSDSDQSELESIILCYGAWLGEWIRIRFSGRWIGLNESTAPRMLVHGEIISPLDAVRRRLISRQAPTLQTLVETIHSIDSLVGGLCRCGFVVEDVVEPPHADAWAAEGTPEHRAQFLPPYLKIKARRRTGSSGC